MVSQPPKSSTPAVRSRTKMVTWADFLARCYSRNGKAIQWMRWESLRKRVVKLNNAISASTMALQKALAQLKKAATGLSMAQRINLPSNGLFSGSLTMATLWNGLRPVHLFTATIASLGRVCRFTPVRTRPLMTSVPAAPSPRCWRKMVVPTNKRLKQLKELGGSKI